MKLFSKPSASAEQADQPFDDKSALIAELTARMEQLEARVAQLEEQLASIGQPADAQPTASEPAVAPAAEAADTADEVQPTWTSGAQGYAGAPTTDGLFPALTTDERVGESIYRFTLLTEQTAHFELLPTPDAIATATISLSQFVKPACKIDSNPTNQPRHVANLAPGTAVLTPDGWRVSEKAHVSFSS